MWHCVTFDVCTFSCVYFCEILKRGSTSWVSGKNRNWKYSKPDWVEFLGICSVCSNLQHPLGEQTGDIYYFYCHHIIPNIFVNKADFAELYIMTHNRGYYDVFVRTCAKYPSNVAVRHYVNEEYKTYTYSELYGVCEYIAQNLQQLQCNRGVIGLVSERNIIIPCVIAA